MQFLKDNKTYIILVLLAVVGIWFYMAYFSKPSSSPTLSEQTLSPLSQDILTTLASLNTIKLDNTIFTDPLFTSLTDYGVPISPQNAGRRNPFAPI